MKEIAQRIIHDIVNDNGLFNRHEKIDDIVWVDEIALKSKVFFTANPGMLADEFFVDLCCGMQRKVKAKYSGLFGFNNLDGVVQEFYEYLLK